MLPGPVLAVAPLDRLAAGGAARISALPLGRRLGAAVAGHGGQEGTFRREGAGDGFTPVQRQLGWVRPFIWNMFPIDSNSLDFETLLLRITSYHYTQDLIMFT